MHTKLECTQNWNAHKTGMHKFSFCFILKTVGFPREEVDTLNLKLTDIAQIAL